MDHRAARKILQSSQSYRNDASPTPIRGLLLTGGARRGWRCCYGTDRWLASAASASASALVDGGGELLAAHSTAHASDIISHVTLIFESSRYVDCIRSASASLPCNIPLPSFRLFPREPPTTIATYPPLFSLSLLRTLSSSSSPFQPFPLFPRRVFVFLSRQTIFAGAL